MWHVDCLGESPEDISLLQTPENLDWDIEMQETQEAQKLRKRPFWQQQPLRQSLR